MKQLKTIFSLILCATLFVNAQTDKLNSNFYFSKKVNKNNSIQISNPSTYNNLLGYKFDSQSTQNLHIKEESKMTNN